MGSPASAKISARRKASSGVSGAGLKTTVHPAASDGASLAAAMKSGTFHGAMAPTTPTGSLVTSTCGFSMPARTSSKAYEVGQVGVVVEDHGRCQHLAHAGEGDRRAHLPGDDLGHVAHLRHDLRRDRRAGSRPASAGVMRGQGPWSKAVRAAATALSMSASVPSGTRAMTSSVDGEIEPMVSVPSGATQSPPMNKRS